MNLWTTVTPDFPDLIRVERVGRAEDQRAGWLQMPPQITEEEAGVFKVLDDLAGDDGVELPTKVHGFGVRTHDLKPPLRQHSHPFLVDVDTDGVGVELDYPPKQGIRFSLEAFGRSLFPGASIHATHVHHRPRCHERTNNRHAVADTFFEHDLLFPVSKMSTAGHLKLLLTKEA